MPCVPETKPKQVFAKRIVCVQVRQGLCFQAQRERQHSQDSSDLKVQYLLFCRLPSIHFGRCYSPFEASLPYPRAHPCEETREGASPHHLRGQCPAPRKANQVLRFWTA